jgi:hypothetical protein
MCGSNPTPETHGGVTQLAARQDCGSCVCEFEPHASPLFALSSNGSGYKVTDLGVRVRFLPGHHYNKGEQVDAGLLHCPAKTDLSAS